MRTVPSAVGGGVAPDCGACWVRSWGCKTQSTAAPNPDARCAYRQKIFVQDVVMPEYCKGRKSDRQPGDAHSRPHPNAINAQIRAAIHIFP